MGKTILRQGSTVIIMLIILMLSSCGKKAQTAENKMKVTKARDNIANVSVVKASKQLYSSEVVSNGLFQATQKASLRFRTANDKIEKIYVHNGEKVSKGEPIVKLEQFKFKNNYKVAKNNLARTRLELENVLIGQGYSLKDSADVPEEVMKMAKVKSGYDNSCTSYEMAKYNYENSILYAPFLGIVGNLNSKENNYIESGKPFCTIIDNKQFDVVFQVLESEVQEINKGDKIKVYPYSMDAYALEGKIMEINPIVNPNGMIVVLGRVTNSNSKIFDGMNVSVKVECRPQEKLVIPKSALVLRSNKKVVFTLKDGLAMWNYVETGGENSESYVILNGIKAGDSVIYEGNMNLAHEAPVKVIK